MVLGHKLKNIPKIASKLAHYIRHFMILWKVSFEKRIMAALFSMRHFNSGNTEVRLTKFDEQFTLSL